MAEEVEGIVLEFARAERAGEPHAFRFAPQQYLLRTPGGGFESAELAWTPALLRDLRAVREPDRDPALVHRVGEVLRAFLATAGWDAHERAIVRAVRDGRRFHVTLRSAAAELYALPWELLALRSTGQLIGGIPGLLVRYEWPETTSFPDRGPPAARRGRVLYAWSAAGGAVPAAEHLAALREALGERLDTTRDVVAHASFAAIAGALAAARRDGPPIDALHLLCHGAAIGGTYGLALDDESAGGRAIPVDAGRMQQLIAPHAGMLRMVVIAACDSGNTGEPGNHLGSVAQMIHRAGVPALVASRFPLSAAGSSRFTAAFYPALAREHASLEQAFLTARDALVRDPSQLDWASLQLYSRAADGDRSYPLGPPRGEPAAPVIAPRSVVLAPRRWPLALFGGLALAAIVATVTRMSASSDPHAAPTDRVIAAGPTDPPIVTPPRSQPEPVSPLVTAPALPPVTAPEHAPSTPIVPAKPRPPVKATPDAPVRPGKCPAAVTEHLGNALPDSSRVDDRVELDITVAASGAPTARVRSGPEAQGAAAQALLDRISTRRLADAGAGQLPCTARRTWLP